MGDTYCVYMHKNLKNGKRYIGITKMSPEQRWRKGFGYWGNKHFKSAILKYGWESFSHEIIQDNLSFQNASELEKALIEKYKSNLSKFGYNRSAGGEQPAYRHTYIPSKKTKEKMSKSHLGKRHSPDAIKHIRESKAGKGNGKSGMFGKDCGQANKIHKINMSGEIVETYFGVGEICRKFGYKSPSKIGDVCRGKRRTAYGYKWKYAEV